MEEDLSGLGFRRQPQFALLPDVCTLWDLGSVSSWASCPHMKPPHLHEPRKKKLVAILSSKSFHPLAFL